MKTRRAVSVFVGLAMFAAAGVAAQEGGRNPGPDLVGGLLKTKGCLGVETAQTRAGKQVIFAWFKDKKAIGSWYYSETHQGVLDAFIRSDDYTGHKPLAHVPDDAGPILVIASITPAAEAKFGGIDMPISQIAIELYEVLPGGAFLGSRFAPDTVTVEHMMDYTPPEAITDPG